MFLTGQDEIEAAVQQVRRAAADLEPGLPRLTVLGLYAAQMLSVQQKVFLPTKPGTNNVLGQLISTHQTFYLAGFRKVVISTNVAETSLTISGIRYVIDSGRVKAK